MHDRPTRRRLREFFSFPSPVNDKAARTVATAVLAAVILILITGSYWLTIPLCYGFWARVLAGPRLSPLGWLAMNVIAPRLGERRPVPGAPKRFAQAIGAVMTSAALVLALALDLHTAAGIVLACMIPAAGLEAIFGYCVGCRIFGLLIRTGAIPDDVCAECADLTLRWNRPAAP